MQLTTGDDSADGVASRTGAASVSSGLSEPKPVPVSVAAAWAEIIGCCPRGRVAEADQRGCAVTVRSRCDVGIAGSGAFAHGSPHVASVR